MLADGIHTLKVTVTQTDGLTSTLTTSFSTDANELLLTSQLNALVRELKQLNTELNSNVSSLSSRLSQTNSTVGSLTDATYVLAAVATAAIVIGVVALRRKPKPPQGS